jgi:hypothetical protein
VYARSSATRNARGRRPAAAAADAASAWCEAGNER